MRTPPIGANLWIWDSPVTTEVIREQAPRLAAWGFDLVELPLETPGDWEPVEVRKILDECGLQAGVCAAMAPGRDLTTADPGTVRATTDYLLACIDAAATIGARVVAGPMYAPTGRTGTDLGPVRSGHIDAVVRNMAALLDAAEQGGVLLAVEPLNRFETSLFNTVDQAMELIERVDRPSLGLLLDTFHLNIEERDIGAAIRLAGDRLYHFHACGNDRGAPGNDAIDWVAVRDALRDIDYQGAVSIESFTSANRTIATAASIWRPLAPSQDAIATEGLAFLRKLFAS